MAFLVYSYPTGEPGTIAGTSTDIETYNQFVQNFAAASPQLSALGTTWRAVVSTPTMSAKDNISFSASASGTTIFNLFGDVVAYGDADLWDGALSNPIYTTADGWPLRTAVWTMSTAGGEWIGTTYLSGVLSKGIGLSDETGEDWMHSGFDYSGQRHGIYGISDAITIATSVPEGPPGWSGVLTVGALMAVGTCMRRKAA